MLHFLSKYALAIILAESYSHSRKHFLVVPSSCMRTEKMKSLRRFTSWWYPWKPLLSSVFEYTETKGELTHMYWFLDLPIHPREKVTLFHTHNSCSNRGDPPPLSSSHFIDIGRAVPVCILCALSPEITWSHCHANMQITTSSCHGFKLKCWHPFIMAQHNLL